MKNIKKNRVILINSSLSYEHKALKNRVYPSTAVMLLATTLYNAGWRVTLLDGNLYDIERFKKELKRNLEEDVLYVGMSVMTCQIPWAYEISKFIKSYKPEIWVIWGGAHPTLFPEQTARDKNVDIVVINEAISQTIVPLTQAISNNDSLDAVPGICYFNDCEVVRTKDACLDDINDLAFINFELMNHRRYAVDNFLWTYSSKYAPGKHTITYPMVTGLGCAYKCKFCINVILRRRYRWKNAAEIVDGVEALQKRYGAGYIKFFDEDFFINRNRVFEFLDLVEKRKLKFYYRAWLRVDHFRDDYINVDVAKRLYKNGFIIAVMGAESGSQKILDCLDKGITIEQILRASRILKETNIVPKFSFMAGLPGETKSDLLETRWLVERLRSENSRADVSVINYRPYPGSPLYNILKDNQLLKEPKSLEEWSKINTLEGYGYFSIHDSSWISDPRMVQNMMHVK